MKIHFEKVSLKHLPVIFDWLALPHVQEFWDNTQAHKDDIVNFVQGRKTYSAYADGKYVYWLASIPVHEDAANQKLTQVALAMLMTIQETQQDDIGPEKLSRLSKTGNTYGLDYMIGNPSYIGKGYGPKILSDFLIHFRENIDPKADTFFIDPASDNTRATHVYLKAGFEHVCDFVMQGDYSGSGKLHHLLVKKY